MSDTLLELIVEGEAAIARRVATGHPVPADWLEYLSRLKRKAAERRLLPEAPSSVSPAPPRYAPGCLFEYAPGHQARPRLRCVAHPSCPREVILWRPEVLAELFALERLVGRAKLDGERDWFARRRETA